MRSLAALLVIASALAASTALADPPPPAQRTPQEWAQELRRQGADMVTFWTPQWARRLENEARSCDAVFTRNGRSATRSCYTESGVAGARTSGYCCYAQQMVNHARESTAAYRRAYRRINPALREALAEQCVYPHATPDRTAYRPGTVIFVPRGCQTSKVTQARSDIEVWLNTGAANTRESFERLLGELSTSRHWLGNLYASECQRRGQPLTGNAGARCMRDLLTRLKEELTQASSSMNRHFSELMSNTSLMLSCRNGSGGDTAFCANRDPWEQRYVSPPDLDVPAYSRWTPPDPHANASSEEPSSPPPAPESAAPASSAVVSPAARPVLRQPRDGHRALLACVAGYHALPESTRRIGRDGVCAHIRGTGLEPFAGELIHILSDSMVEHYFEALRMEAISRLMTAHRQITGTDLPSNPASCAPFQAGMNAHRASATPEPVAAWHALSQTPQYRNELREAARIIPLIAAEIEDWKRVPNNTQYLPPGMSMNPLYAEAQAQIRTLRQSILAYYNTYPFLNPSKASSSGRQPEESLGYVQRFANANDSQLQRLIENSRTDLGADVRATIQQFCNDDPSQDGLSWQQLIQNPQLTRSVLTAFPQFQVVQSCAMNELEEIQGLKNGAMAMGMVGCTVGMIANPLMFGIGCGALLSAQSLAEANEAHRRLISTSRCHAAGGGTVCDNEAYLSAREHYETAVNQAMLTVGASVLTSAPGIWTQLKNLSKTMNARQLQSAAARIARARSVAEIEAVMAEIQATPRLNVQVVLGRELSPAQQNAVQRVLGTEGYDASRALTPAEIARQERLLTQSGITQAEIQELRQAGVLSNLRETTSAALPERVRHIQVAERELNTQTASQLTQGRRYHYILDDEGHLLLTEQPVQAGAADLIVARVGEGSAARSVVVREAGTVERVPGTSEFRFRPTYGTNTARSEAQALLRNEGVVAGETRMAARAGAASETRVLSCMDIMQANLNGSGMILENLIAFNSLTTGVLLMQEASGSDAGRLSTQQGRLQSATENATSNVALVGSVALSREMLRRDWSTQSQLATRTAYGVTANYLQGLILREILGDSGVDEAAADERARALTTYNQGHLIARIPINQMIDRTIMQRLPALTMSACQRGSPLQIIVSPGAVRLVERGLSMIIYYTAREAIIGQ